MAAKGNGGQGKRSQRVEPAAQAGKKPGGEPSLSLERIVATAVELLDAEGIDGLKMRRLADRLGAGVMSLYWHVANKEEVFDLALDAVFAYRPRKGSSPRTGAGMWFTCSKTGAQSCCAIPGRRRCCRAGRSARMYSAAWKP